LRRDTTGRKAFFSSGDAGLPHFFIAAIAGRLRPTEQQKLSELNELERIAESLLETLGFELVDLERAGHRARPILRLRIDRRDAPPGAGVTVDDCAAVSRALEEVLDERADLLPSYILEVSSPGVERPLRKRRDFERHLSMDVRLRGFQPLVGRSKHVEGSLVAIDDSGEVEQLRLRTADGLEVEIPLTAIAKANLVYRWDEARSGSAMRQRGTGED
jgi:ribosome maturation factor RimP